ESDMRENRFRRREIIEARRIADQRFQRRIARKRRIDRLLQGPARFAHGATSSPMRKTRRPLASSDSIETVSKSAPSNRKRTPSETSARLRMSARTRRKRLVRSPEAPLIEGRRSTADQI